MQRWEGLHSRPLSCESSALSTRPGLLYFINWLIGFNVYILIKGKFQYFFNFQIFRAATFSTGKRPNGPWTAAWRTRLWPTTSSARLTRPRDTSCSRRRGRCNRLVNSAGEWVSIDYDVKNINKCIWFTDNEYYELQGRCSLLSERRCMKASEKLSSWVSWKRTEALPQCSWTCIPGITSHSYFYKDKKLGYNCWGLFLSKT